MKKVITLLFCLFSATANYAQANIDVMDKEAIEMLKYFYSAYTQKDIAYNKSTPVNTHFRQLDSIAQKFCTEKTIKKSREMHKDGYDLLTIDYMIDPNAPNSLSVVKDKAKPNTYVVSFLATDELEPAKKIAFHVHVVKEGDVYKIDDVR